MPERFWLALSYLQLSGLPFGIVGTQTRRGKEIAMYALARVRLTGVVLVLLAGIGACGGGSALSAPTTSGAPAATTPTTADRVASLADVFAAPLPAGYSLADAPADQRNSVRQPLQTADGAKVVRDIDLRVIRRAGRTIGSVFVFLLQPGQELQEAAIVKGYAESRSGSSLERGIRRRQERHPDQVVGQRRSCVRRFDEQDRRYHRCDKQTRA